jgi:hypothetical protein
MERYNTSRLLRKDCFNRSSILPLCWVAIFAILSAFFTVNIQPSSNNIPTNQLMRSVNGRCWLYLLLGLYYSIDPYGLMISQTIQNQNTRLILYNDVWPLPLVRCGNTLIKSTKSPAKIDLPALGE